MKNFDRAYMRLINHEGGYSNHPADRGGETYKGIARNFHPDWEGWPTIDSYKDSPQFPHILDSIIMLDTQVQNFYKAEYWDKMRLDDIDSQVVTCEMFDIGVNMGIKRASRFLQQALNLLNRNEKNYLNIAEDGVIGSGTIGTVNKLMSIDNDRLLYNVLNLLQGEFYLKIMRKKESQEVFARGWLARVDIRKY
jgi:lysozyme family protein